MVEIIAEAGVNHMGSLRLAIELADVAKEVGADVAKFQTFDTDKLVRSDHPDYKAFKMLELGRPDFVTLAKHCQQIEIEFMSTPGDADSLKFLTDECGVKRIKIGSDDLTNKPLLTAAFRTGLPVILSTGMATVDEIFQALDMDEAPPDGKLTLLHCVSLYPCLMELANLRAIQSMKKIFHCPIGYSDHTEGIIACVTAAALGAVMIEKHLKIMIDCPDAAVSIRAGDFRTMVDIIKEVEKLLGTGRKAPCEAELESIKLFRKGPDGLRQA